MPITFSNLHRLSESYKEKEYIFKDLFLDLEKEYVMDMSSMTRIDGNDLRASFDESAIKNSLRNLFNTKPGQRFLFPEYGLDLNNFLFEAVSDTNAEIIGDTIVRGVETYEPRVKVQQCRIKPKPEEHEYDITIVFSIPALNVQSSISSVMNLDQQRFIFVDTSRTR